MRSKLVVSRLLPTLLLAAFTAVQASAQASPQSSDGQGAGKKPLTIEDYSRWRNIEGARISSDGRWVVYALRHTNALAPDQKPELHIYDNQTSQEVVIANAHTPDLSRDARWVVYQVDSVPAVRGGRGQGQPADSATTGRAAGPAQTSQPARTELRELATGRTQSWRNVQSAQFNASSTHLLLRRRAQGGGGGGGGAGGGGGGGGAGGGRGGGAGGAAPAAGDVLLHDLAAGNSMLLGSVGDAQFNRQGDLLAYAIEQTVRDANGLMVMNLAGDQTFVLENDTLIYSRIRWSDDGNAVAALKGRPVERMRERDNRLVAYSNVRGVLQRGTPTRVALDRSAQGFPQGFMISERGAVAWSEDGRRVTFGIIQQTPAADSTRRINRDSVPDVDVWTTEDDRVQSVQMGRVDQERNFTFTQAFDAVQQRYVTLTDSTVRTVEIPAQGRWGVGFADEAYVADTAFAKADVYRIDLDTGERSLMLRGQLVGPYQYGLSPDGKYFIYWDNNRYQAWDLATGAARTLPGGENGSFANVEWDYVGPRPAYGVEGFASDGSGVIVRDRYDLWLLPFGSGAARNVTNGEGNRNEIRFRYVRTEPIDSAASRRVRSGREIDLSRPLTLTAYGQWTKKSGFYRLTGGRLQELVYDDASFSTPVRAERAERFLLTRQTFAEFPDLRVSGPAFTDHKKISDANPQQSEYLWGRRVLFDYTNRDGVKLQGIVALPDDYQQGERRPMLVNFYEKNSQNMHSYPMPSFVSGMGSIPWAEALGRGYIAMQADVHYRTGSSHSDQMEGVEAATRKVIEMGYADPAKIGVNGHSYGGEGAAYIGTRSKLFAAVGMGAGVTDLTSDFVQTWGWSYQIPNGNPNPGSDYYMFGQGRWGTTPWDNPELFRQESALTHVRDATAPFLIMHGAADPTVSFTEGLNFYHALRYNNKKAILLAYPEEGHGLRGLANRRDLTVRYFDFFDHYLKGTPAPKWMTDGVPYIVKTAPVQPPATN